MTENFDEFSTFAVYRRVIFGFNLSMMMFDSDINVLHFLQTSDAFRNPAEFDDVTMASSRIFCRNLSGRSAMVFDGVALATASSSGSFLTDLMRFGDDDSQDSLYRFIPAMAKIRCSLQKFL